MVHTLQFFQFLKDIQMTLHDNKTHDTSSATTVEEHHKQAAEHLELAAKSHKEAAKLVAGNNHAASQTHVKTAHEHVAKAHDHVVEAAKKSAPAAK